MFHDDVLDPHEFVFQSLLPEVLLGISLFVDLLDLLLGPLLTFPLNQVVPDSCHYVDIPQQITRQMTYLSLIAGRSSCRSPGRYPLSRDIYPLPVCILSLGISPISREVSSL